jgi:pyrroloquinoline quinone biosynthesis protein B
MLLRVLGSSAGGGFPQWNCNCSNCDGVRRGTLRARRRTQSSIIASGNGTDWLLFNASPDILQQIQSAPALQPARALRDTGIQAIVLIDGQVDHTTGLYMLRERGQPLDIWCTEAVHADLTQGNPIFRVLDHYCRVSWHPLPLGDSFSIPGISGLHLSALPLKSKAAPYSPHRDQPQPGDNIGVTLRDSTSGKSVFYAPGLGEIEPAVWQAMVSADCVMVDGTFWTDDEMVRLGISAKSARDIGHLPQSGAGGMIGQLDRLPRSTRKILIHINNTNPILDEDSAERRTLAEHGIEVAYDGMELSL